jgi:pimeloyl-ACP methyl ester carboxylesterase
MTDSGLHFSVYSPNQITEVPLIILHGLFGSGDNWKNIAQSLAQNRNVYTLDLRNHGQSFWSESMSYSDMAADVYQFLEEASIQRCVIMGHSMGGKVTMQLLAKHDSRFQRAIVVDIAPKAYPFHHQDIILALQAVINASCTQRGEAQRIMAQHIRDFRVIAFLLKSFNPNSPEHVWQFNVDAIDDCYTDIALEPRLGPSKINCPTLFIRGAQSDYICVPEDEILLSQYFENADIYTVPNAGHWVHAEASNQFVAAVNGFI